MNNIQTIFSNIKKYFAIYNIILIFALVIITIILKRFNIAFRRTALLIASIVVLIEIIIWVINRCRESKFFWIATLSTIAVSTVIIAIYFKVTFLICFSVYNHFFPKEYVIELNGEKVVVTAEQTLFHTNVKYYKYYNPIFRSYIPTHTDILDGVFDPNNIEENI